MINDSSYLFGNLCLPEPTNGMSLHGIQFLLCVRSFNFKMDWDANKNKTSPCNAFFLFRVNYVILPSYLFKWHKPQSLNLFKYYTSLHFYKLDNIFFKSNLHLYLELCLQTLYPQIQKKILLCLLRNLVKHYLIVSISFKKIIFLPILYFIGTWY